MMMNLMILKAQCVAETCKEKTHAWFKRVFKEQAGGAELIATLVIIGIVLIIAFAFKNSIADMVEDLWDKLVKNGDKNTAQGDVVGDFQWET